MSKKSINKFFKKIFQIIWLSLFISEVDAQSCPDIVYSFSSDTTIIFINGIANSREDACIGANSLRETLAAEGIDIRKLKWSQYYNPTDWRVPLINLSITDIEELFVQATYSDWALELNPVTDSDYYKNLGRIYESKKHLRGKNYLYTGEFLETINVINNTYAIYDLIKEKAQTGYVVLIPHSQGNAYVEAAYSILELEESPLLSKIRVVGIAPVSARPPGKAYIRHTQDAAIYMQEHYNSIGLNYYKPAPPTSKLCYKDPCKYDDGADKVGLIKITGDNQLHALVQTYLNPKLGDGSLGYIPGWTLRRDLATLVTKELDHISLLRNIAGNLPIVSINLPTLYPTTTSAVVFEPKVKYRPNGDIVSYTWDFGDGSTFTTSGSNDVRHLYTTAGRYNVSVKITDIKGVTNFANRIFDVTSIPTPPLITHLVPNTTVVGRIQKFSVIGMGLPNNDNLNITVNGCTNIAYLNHTENMHEFTCVPQSVGKFYIEVRTVPNGSLLKYQEVIVSAPPKSSKNVSQIFIQKDSSLIKENFPIQRDSRSASIPINLSASINTTYRIRVNGINFDGNESLFVEGAICDPNFIQKGNGYFIQQCRTGNIPGDSQKIRIYDSTYDIELEVPQEYKYMSLRAPIIAPLPPALVNVGGGNVKITWNMVSGADQYEVTDGQSVVARVDAPSTTATVGQQAEKNTCYRVRAIVGGTASQYSSEACITLNAQRCNGIWHDGQYSVGTSEVMTQGCPVGYTGQKEFSHVCESGGNSQAPGVWGKTSVKGSCRITPITFCVGIWDGGRNKFAVNQVESRVDACTGGQLGKTTTSHTCLSGGSWAPIVVTGACTCPSGQVYQDGACTTPRQTTCTGSWHEQGYAVGAVEILYSSCTGGMVGEFYQSHTCRSNLTWTPVQSTSSCECPDGKVLYQGVCTIRSAVSCPGSWHSQNYPIGAEETRISSCQGGQTGHIYESHNCRSDGSWSRAGMANDCACPSGQVLQNGVCTTPPAVSCQGSWSSARYLVDQVETKLDACTGGQVGNITITHTCRSNGTWSGSNGVNNCACPSGQVLQNGICTTPPPVTGCQGAWTSSRYLVDQVETKLDACTGGQLGNITNTHTCRSNGTWSPSYGTNNCTCPSGQVLQNGVCTTPPPVTCQGAWSSAKYLVDQVESKADACTGGQIGALTTSHTCRANSTWTPVSSSSTCACPSGKVLQNGVCITPPVATCTGSWHSQNYPIGAVEDQYLNTCPTGTTGQVRHFHTCQVGGTWSPTADSDNCQAVLLPPTGINASNVSMGVQLTWTAVPGATRYYITRDSDTDYSYVPSTNWTDPNARDGAYYCYAIASYSSFNNSKSANSAPICITYQRGSQGEVSPPQNVAASRYVAGARKGIQLTWTSSESVDSYFVYRYGSENILAPLAGTDTSFIDWSWSDTNSGGSYCYFMRAFKNNVISLQSNVACSSAP